ncbi:DsbA family protein [Tunturiibacter psychrotolerans]|uniref:DsbA family protein n=1 Tax=Tunturiibacter psychrotolerans TaxID=3069686 RepID=UPI00333FB48D
MGAHSSQGQRRDRRNRACNRKQRQLDVSAIHACVAKQDASVIKKSQLEADTLGIVRTPTLFINGAKIEGVVPLPFLFQIIDGTFRSQGIQPPVVANTK